MTQCQHLFQLGAFRKLLVFLLGADRVGLNPPSPASSPRENNPKPTPSSQKGLAIPLPAPSPTSTLQRRWSQTQAKDFHDLHTTMSTMILNCDLMHLQGSSEGSVASGIIPVPPEVTAVLHGQSSVFYLQVCCIFSFIFACLLFFFLFSFLLFFLFFCWYISEILSFAGIGGGVLSFKQH